VYIQKIVEEAMDAYTQGERLIITKAHAQQQP
jgi:hypothetical protein